MKQKPQWYYIKEFTSENLLSFKFIHQQNMSSVRKMWDNNPDELTPQFIRETFYHMGIDPATTLFFMLSRPGWSCGELATFLFNATGCYIPENIGIRKQLEATDMLRELFRTAVLKKDTVLYDFSKFQKEWATIASTFEEACQAYLMAISLQILTLNIGNILPNAGSRKLVIAIPSNIKTTGE